MPLPTSSSPHHPLIPSSLHSASLEMRPSTSTQGYPIATLETHFRTGYFLRNARAFSLAGFVTKTIRQIRQNATSDAQRGDLNQYAWGHERLSISSGFSGLLFAMHACSEVSLYGFDLGGGSPGHYFDDATEGIVSRLEELARKEPRRRKSLSVDPGIQGLTFSALPRGRRRQDRGKQGGITAGRAREYRRWIEQQYTNETTSHPYTLERGLLRMFAERGCIRLGTPGTRAHTRSFADAKRRPPRSKNHPR